MTVRTFVMIASVLLAAATAQAQYTVERRGTADQLIGEITPNDAGVLVRTSFGAEHFVPWDRVRSIDPAPKHTRYEEWIAVATDLWRARSRVERNDTTLAEPLLERLFERFAGQTHETALIVAEGLLRCRLARGAHAAAVLPALETARLRRAGVATSSYAGLPPVLDGRTNLCPALAPVWLDSPALVKLRRDLGDYDGQGDETIEALARLYGASAASAAGIESAVPALDLADPGVSLLHAAVACLADDAGEREAGRTAMAVRFEDETEWIRAWARFCVGFSGIADTDVIDRQRAMVHLLHLPARHARTHPFLAGLAMALVADGLEASGDSAHADAMRREIATSFPAHPVGNWPVAGARRGLPSSARRETRDDLTTKEFG